MLVRLFGRNFRSFRESFELSLVAADLHRKDDAKRGHFTVRIDGIDEPLRLLRAVAIYGPNASGKSSLLTAGRAIWWIVSHSSQRMKPEEPLPPYDPFMLDPSTSTAPVELGCDVVLKDRIIRYQVSYDRIRIHTERLSTLNGESEVVLIDRTADGTVQGKLVEKGNVNALYVTEMQPNVAVLSKLAQHGPSRGEQSATPYYKAIRQSLRCADYSDATGQMVEFPFGPGSRDHHFSEKQDYREWIMNHLIQKADVGISDVRITREPVTFPAGLKEFFERHHPAAEVPDERVVISFIHEGVVRKAIDFSEESAGTKKLFNISGDLWALAHKDGAVLADELSASLHPRLLNRLIHAVNSPPNEGVRSQLVFATHDTGLLESYDGEPPALRRDQVYFTRKDVNGASQLYSLAEFKDEARPVHNLRKRYLSGVFGALPAVEKLSL